MLAVGVIAFALTHRRLRPFEVNLLGLAFAAHALGAFAQVRVTQDVYGRGDMSAYHYTGSLLAALIRYDPERFLPEVLRLLVHQEVDLPFRVLGVGTPTGSMHAISGLIALPLADSLHAMCMVLSLAAFFGQRAIYLAFRELYPDELHPKLLIATTLVPSAVYWTSGLLKETVAVAGFGLCIFGIHRALVGRGRSAIAPLLVGLPTVALLKPYILFGLVLATSVWWYWRRVRASGGSVRPFALVLGGTAAVALLILLGDVFPRYGLAEIAEETANLQVVGARIRGGSGYQLVAPETRGPLAQLAYAPIALITALFRPFLFEARSATAVVNALETTILTLLLARAVWVRGLTTIRSRTLGAPMLVFCVAFVALFGVAVGLASTNLGSLSRYRAPLVPLYAVLVVIWGAPPMAARARAPAADGSEARPDPASRRPLRGRPTRDPPVRGRRGARSVRPRAASDAAGGS